MGCIVGVNRPLPGLPLTVRSGVIDVSSAGDRGTNGL